MSSQKGYSTQEKDDRLSAQFQTIEPVRELQYGSTVVSHQFVYLVDGNIPCQAGTTAEQIIAPIGHAVLKGDVLVIVNTSQEVKVWDVDGQTITLAETLPAAPATLDLVACYRHKYPLVDSGGVLQTTSVEQATAASGDPLPAVQKVIAGYDYSGSQVHVISTDSVGVINTRVIDLPPDAATETTLATLATEATVSTLATEATVATLATEATVSTLATEATVATLATAAAQTDGTQKSQIVDGAGNVISSTSNALDVNLKSPVIVDVNLDEADDSVAVFGYDGTVNRAIKTDASGELQVDILSSALPTGAATETTLNAIKTAVELIDNTVSGNELQVDIVSSALPSGAATETTLLAIEADTTSLAGCVSGSEVQVDVVSSALPSGAATETTLGAVKTSVELIDDAVVSDGAVFAGKGLIIAGVTAGGVAQIIETNASGHVHVADGGGSLTVDATSWPLPTGAATESTLSTLNGKVTDCNTGAVTISTALPSGTNTIGKIDVNTLSVVDLLDAGILDTSSTNINGSASAPTQVVASTAAATKKLQLLDTTGAFIGVYTGAALSEVLELVMGPGSDQTIEHSIPAGTRISLKRLDSTTAISSGIVAINFLG
jgi:hypothetical protein